MKLPDFYIIGAAKSGTTSLQEYLSQHKEVFFPTRKEPNYFALANMALPRPGPVRPEVLYNLLYSRSITDFEDYVKIFENAGAEQAIGEASVRYLYFEKASHRIKEKTPDAKFIVMLREPVGRLYSHYCMNVQYQLEPLDLMNAIEAESDRKSKDWGWDWHYTGIGLYTKQLKRYFDLFSKEQIRVFLYDDFVANPVKVTQDICQFIRVDNTFVPDMGMRGKVAYRGKNKALDRWLHWPSRSRKVMRQVLPGRVNGRLLLKLRTMNSMPVPKLDGNTRVEIARYFNEDIKELGDLLGRNIPWKY